LFKTDELQYLRIRLSSADNSADETVIKFSGEASKRYEVMEDAKKMFNEMVNISSISADGFHMAINGHPSIENKQSIKLAVYAKGAAQTLSMNFTEFHQIPQGVIIWLKDNFTQTLTNITANPSYTFAVTADSASKGTERFVLVFETNPTNPVGVNELNAKANAGGITIYPVPARNEVFVSGFEGKGELKVMNALGQVMLSKQVETQPGQPVSIAIDALKDGVYFIEITRADGQAIKGRFVKQ
jgi:hypothetical protein